MSRKSVEVPLRDEGAHSPFPGFPALPGQWFTITRTDDLLVFGRNRMPQWVIVWRNPFGKTGMTHGIYGGHFYVDEDAAMRAAEHEAALFRGDE